MNEITKEEADVMASLLTCGQCGCKSVDPGPRSSGCCWCDGDFPAAGYGQPEPEPCGVCFGLCPCSTCGNAVS